jgi:hypothetical protein
MSDGPPLHPALEPLAFVLGTWKGKGVGVYPTIENFEYLEVAGFTHVGKPFIAYTQRTRDASTGEPLHTETGYLRPVDDSRAEFMVAQPSGIVEVLDVEIRATALRMSSTTVVQTPTAKDVAAVIRQLSVTRDEMRYAVQMAAVGQEMQIHLEAVLTRD